MEDEVIGRMFDVNPTSVLGILVGGMSIVILYLVYENRALRLKCNELTDKLIELTTTLIEKLSDIKSGISEHSNQVVNKVDQLMLWLKATIRNKE